MGGFRDDIDVPLLSSLSEGRTTVWNVESVRAQQATLDFTSSGRGKRDVQQLLFDGVTVANVVELSGWSEGAFQILVCDQCGIEHCEPGNWLVLRRISESVALLPAFDNIESDNGGSEYSPPKYVHERGAPTLTRQRYGELREIVPDLPSIEAVASLSCREAALLLKTEAPARVMGRLHEATKLRRERVVAVSNGDLTDRIEQLEGLVAAALERPDVEARVLDESDGTAVTFHLDIPQFPDWTPMLLQDRTASIRLEPGVELAIPTDAVQ